MKVILAGYTGLGNFILKTPMIKSLLERNVEVHILCENKFGIKALVNDVEGILLKEIPSPGKISILNLYYIWKDIKKEKYDWAILPFDSSPLFVKLVLIFTSIKTAFHIRPRLLTLRSRILESIFKLRFNKGLEVPAGRHEIDLNFDLIDIIFDESVKRSYQMFISPKRGSIENLSLASGDYIILQPGGASGSLTSKVWATENWESLALELITLYPKFKILLVGESADLKVMDSHCFDSQVIDLIGKTTLFELFSLIEKARLIISHDSGVMHIASAMNKPQIALYGPTDDTRTKPLNTQAKLVFTSDEFRRAMYDFEKTEEELSRKYGKNCMTTITVNQVISAAKEIINE